MITAAFDSECLECGHEILRGEAMGFVFDEWVCEDCVEDHGGEDDEQP